MVVKVEFVALAAKTDIEYIFRSDKEDPNPDASAKLGGSTSHTAKAKISPSEGRDYVDIRLFQTVNSLLNIPRIGKNNVAKNENDDDYNNDPASSTYVKDWDEDDKLKITYSDYPGVDAPSAARHTDCSISRRRI